MTLDIGGRVIALALFVFVLAVLVAGVYAGGQLGDALSQVVTVSR